LVAGGETVMYRHDKTFVNETIISVSLSCNDVDFLEKLEKIASYKIERIGQIFKVNAIYLDGDKESELYKKSMISIQEKGLVVIEAETENYKIVFGENIEKLVENSENSLKLSPNREAKIHIVRF
jgi:CO dehydrogenase/acetyl-CoA synthase gamma subunit (corrinoid Fe-S protein)